MTGNILQNPYSEAYTKYKTLMDSPLNKAGEKKLRCTMSLRLMEQEKECWQEKFARFAESVDVEQLDQGKLAEIMKEMSTLLDKFSQLNPQNSSSYQDVTKHASKSLSELKIFEKRSEKLTDLSELLGLKEKTATFEQEAVKFHTARENWEFIGVAVNKVKRVDPFQIFKNPDTLIAKKFIEYLSLQDPKEKLTPENVKKTCFSFLISLVDEFMKDPTQQKRFGIVDITRDRFILKPDLRPMQVGFQVEKL